MIQIHLHRRRIGETACDGTIIVSGTRVCDTAEHAQYRPPVGTYHIVLRYSKAHGRKVPVLEEMPGVCIAPGNGIWNCADGRIIVGLYICPGCLKHSRPLFMSLYNRINTALRRGHEITLRITERGTT